MKKTYISPEMEVVRIAVSQMLAVSARGFIDDDAEIDGSGDYDD